MQLREIQDFEVSQTRVYTLRVDHILIIKF